MHVWIDRIRRKPIGFFKVLVPSLLFTAVLGGGWPEIGTGAPDARGGCVADISHPLQVNVVPLGPVRPGAVVTARVEVTSRFRLDDVVLRVRPPTGVQLLSASDRSLGKMQAGEHRVEIVTLIAPADGGRRTVELRVEGSTDDQRLKRGAVLNLVFEQESFRIVNAPDGRQVREVIARRIG